MDLILWVYCILWYTYGQDRTTSGDRHFRCSEIHRLKAEAQRLKATGPQLSNVSSFDSVRQVTLFVVTVGNDLDMRRQSRGLDVLVVGVVETNVPHSVCMQAGNSRCLWPGLEVRGEGFAATEVCRHGCQPLNPWPGRGRGGEVPWW